MPHLEGSNHMRARLDACFFFPLGAINGLGSLNHEVAQSRSSSSPTPSTALLEIPTRNIAATHLACDRKRVRCRARARVPRFLRLGVWTGGSSHQAQRRCLQVSSFFVVVERHLRSALPLACCSFLIVFLASSMRRRHGVEVR